MELSESYLGGLYAYRTELATVLIVVFVAVVVVVGVFFGFFCFFLLAIWLSLLHGMKVR